MRSKKSKSTSFDNISDQFHLDGHDTIVHETEVKNVDKIFKKGKNLGW